jgi:recombination protein RecT
VALAAIRRMPALLNCDRQSLFNAVLAAAQDGLMPDGREGAIVPRKGKANWQPMIAGIYKKVKTSGSVATISANVVYEGEPFDVLLGDDERIVHRRDMAKVADGNEAAVYAIATLKDGTKEREVMTWDQVMTVRQTSSTPNDGPWVTSPGEMARKTVVRRLAKRLPVLDQADEALHRTIGRVDSLYSFGTPAPEAPQPPSSQRDALNAQIPLRPAAAATPRAERRVDPTPYEADPRETDEERWKRNLLAKLASAQSRADVVAVGALKSVHAAQAAGIPELAVWVTKALNDAFARFPADETEAVDDDLDEVVIAGEERLAAG